MSFVEFVVRGVLLGSIYGLLALPMSLSFTTVGTIDFAIGAYALLAAAVASSFAGAFGILAGLLAATVAGVLMGCVFVALERQHHEDPITIALASFGYAIAIGSFVLWRWGTKAFVLQPFDTLWNVGGIRISPQGAINLGTGIVLVAILALVLYRTDLGRMMRAAAINPRGAELAAIPVVRLQFSTFVAGGLLGGIAGLLILYTSGLDFTAGLPLTLAGFGATIVFGVLGPLRAFLGGLTLGVVEAMGAAYAPAGFSEAVPPLFILAVLLSGRFGTAPSGDRA